MLSGFFKAKPAPTRFESTEALKQPLLIINKLRSKEIELKESAEIKGPGSIDYRKHLIILNLIQQIDKAINVFNEVKASPSNETNDVIQLSRKLSEIISNTRRAEEQTLMTTRNNQRENVSNALYYGTFGATFIAGSAVSIGTLGKLATLLYVAPTVSNSVHTASGLNDLSPTSVRLLNELSTVLNNINANLTKKSGAEPESKESDYDDYICPITQDIMKDPVVCTLDGRAYERAAIEQWLKQKRTSPFNRKEIPPGKSVSDVLVTHYNYASILEKYRREHPSLENESAMETKPSL